MTIEDLIRKEAKIELDNYAVQRSYCMTGSKKQKAWAGAIRSEKLEQIDQIVMSYCERMLKHEVSKERFEALRAVAKKLRRENDAKFWIDYKDDEFDLSFIRDYARSRKTMATAA